MDKSKIEITIRGKSPRVGSRFFYTEQEFEYSDIYYGFNPFIGQEVVKRNGSTVWVMNYCGETDCTNIEAGAVYQFLKVALQSPDPALPLRGPSEFIKDGLSYFNRLDGDLDSFYGEETIYYGDSRVYRLLYHGCTVENV